MSIGQLIARPWRRFALDTCPGRPGALGRGGAASPGGRRSSRRRNRAPFCFPFAVRVDQPQDGNEAENRPRAIASQAVRRASSPAPIAILLTSRSRFDLMRPTDHWVARMRESVSCAPAPTSGRPFALSVSTWRPPHARSQEIQVHRRRRRLEWRPFAPRWQGPQQQQQRSGVVEQPLSKQREQPSREDAAPPEGCSLASSWIQAAPHHPRDGAQLGDVALQDEGRPVAIGRQETGSVGGPVGLGNSNGDERRPCARLAGPCHRRHDLLGARGNRSETGARDKVSRRCATSQRTRPW